MHVGGVEVEDVAGRVAALEQAAREHEPLLDDLARDDRDRPARDVVVVEARVVAAHPRDDPDVGVAVAPELLELAALGVEADVRSPRRLVGGETADERAQLVAIEVVLEAERGHGRSRPQGMDLRVGGTGLARRRGSPP